MQLVGRLGDGTPYFAPLGMLPRDSDEDLVQCHLCGGWFRFIGGTHLGRTHGWTVAQYRDAFELRQSAATCSRELSAVHRADAERRIDAGEFGTNYLPPARAAHETAPARRIARWRSLAATHPELVVELHPTRNGKLDPEQIAAGSNRKLWWRCQHGHEWQASVHNRASGSSCPTCTADSHARRLRALARAQRHVAPERSLAVKHPELVAELHPTRNGKLDPTSIGNGSRRKAWWRCSACGYSWRATVSSRAIRGTGCPACAQRLHTQRLTRRNQKLAESNKHVSIERSFAVTHPHLVAELHPKRNDAITPTSIGAGSKQRLWWLCPTCGYEWQTTVGTRTRGSGCPTCARRGLA